MDMKYGSLSKVGKVYAHLLENRITIVNFYLETGLGNFTEKIENRE